MFHGTFSLVCIQRESLEAAASPKQLSQFNSSNRTKYFKPELISRSSLNEEQDSSSQFSRIQSQKSKNSKYHRPQTDNPIVPPYSFSYLQDDTDDHSRSSSYYQEYLLPSCKAMLPLSRHGLPTRRVPRQASGSQQSRASLRSEPLESSPRERGRRKLADCPELAS